MNVFDPEMVRDLVRELVLFGFAEFDEMPVFEDVELLEGEENDKKS